VLKHKHQALHFGTAVMLRCKPRALHFGTAVILTRGPRALRFGITVMLKRRLRAPHLGTASMAVIILASEVWCLLSDDLSSVIFRQSIEPFPKFLKLRG